MASINYRVITLENLRYYDTKLKTYINEADAKSIKAVAIDGYTLKFYKDYPTDEASVPAYEIEIPEVDLTQIKADIESNSKAIGDVSTLTTTAKDLASAVNEVEALAKTNAEAAALTIDTSATTDGYAKSYTVKQGTTTIGVIDIPKDMVVSNGEVVVNPEGQPEGTYIVLTIANATSDKLYINVGTLVDIYTVEANASQIQLAIDPATRAISATIVDGSVTKANLATSVQTSLDKADSAVQTIVAGSANGTIAVDGTDVAVTGLGSAAYTDASAYDAANTASTLVTALENGAVKTNTDDITKLKSQVSDLEATTFTEVTDSDIDGLF